MLVLGVIYAHILIKLILLKDTSKTSLCEKPKSVNSIYLVVKSSCAKNTAVVANIFRQGFHDEKVTKGAFDFFSFN